jgi:hypothetical protein
MPQGQPDQARTVQGPLREAPRRAMPAPRGPRQAFAQGPSAHQELSGFSTVGQ